MWNQFENYKHHYLRLESLESSRSVDIITPVVNAESETTNSERDRHREPSTNMCQNSSYFQDYSQLAYGWGALPKLLRDLCSDDREVRWHANNILTEFLGNPLNAQRAVNEVNIIRFLSNAFLRVRCRGDSEMHMTDSLLNKIGILSVYLDGAKQIASRRNLCNELYEMLITDEEHMEAVSWVFKNLSEKPEVLNQIIEKSEYYEKLAEVFKFDLSRPYYPYMLWMHLSHLLEIAPEKGLELGFFVILLNRIVGRFPKFSQIPMKCFASLLSCEAGLKLFNDVDGISLFYNIFKNEKDLDTYQYLLMALLNALKSKSVLWRCREFIDFPDIIFHLGSKRYTLPDNPKVLTVMEPYKLLSDIQTNFRKIPPIVFVGKENLQLYSFKTLRQMSEMPCIKRYIKANLLHELKQVKCSREINEAARNDLVKFLEREINESHVPAN